MCICIYIYIYIYTLIYVLIMWGGMDTAAGDTVAIQCGR